MTAVPRIGKPGLPMMLHVIGCSHLVRGRGTGFSSEGMLRETVVSRTKSLTTLSGELMAESWANAAPLLDITSSMTGTMTRACIAENKVEMQMPHIDPCFHVSLVSESTLDLGSASAVAVVRCAGIPVTRHQVDPQAERFGLKNNAKGTAGIEEVPALRRTSSTSVSGSLGGKPDRRACIACSRHRVSGQHGAKKLGAGQATPRRGGGRKVTLIILG
jgi:hypothetical protein